MDVFDGPIRHQHTVLEIKILPILRGALDCLLYQRSVFRVNPLKNELHGRSCRCLLVLEDAKRFR